VSNDTSNRLFGFTDQYDLTTELTAGEELSLSFHAESGLLESTVLTRDAAAELRDALAKWLGDTAVPAPCPPVPVPFTPEQEERVRDIVVRHLSELGQARPVFLAGTPRAHRGHAPEDVTHTGTDVWGTPCTVCTHPSGIHTASAGCLAPVDLPGGFSRYCECTRSGTQCTAVPAPVPEVSTVSARLQPIVPDPVKLVCCGHEHLPSTHTCGFTAEPGDDPCPCRGTAPELSPLKRMVSDAERGVQALAAALADRPVKASCTCHRHDHVHKVNDFFCGASGCFCAAPGRRSAV